MVKLWAEFPAGCFAWGCGVLENKSLCIDRLSTLPLFLYVPEFVDKFRTKGSRSCPRICWLGCGSRLGKWHLVERCSWILQDRLTVSFDRVNELTLLRPRTAVFIDWDNWSLLGSSSESCADSEFLAFPALVCWRSSGGSMFPRNSVHSRSPYLFDLEDSIIG